MKKILFIASERVDLKSGGGLANRAFLDSLMTHYPQQVDVIQLRHYSNDIDKAPFYFVPQLSKISQLQQIICGHPHRLYKWMPSFLKEHGSEYSHCIINQSWYGDLIPMLKTYGIKVAVIHHNYEAKYQMDNKLPSTLYGLTPAIIRRNERKALNLSSLNMYLTQSDFHKLSQVYGPHGIGKDAVIGIYEPAESGRSKNIPKYPLPYNELVICGSLNNKQTEDAVINFFEDYYHILDDTYCKDFRLIITGRNPGNTIQSLATQHKHVELIANPENIEDIIQQSGILICPVNRGSGLKLRIMDGMRLGLPILTHEISSHGYEPFFSYPWFQIYHDHKTFMSGLKQIVSLIGSKPTLRNEIAECYQKFFSFECGDKRFIKAISSFLEH